ncbi:MAG: response regulator [Pseudomonadales bacterium]
MVRKRALVVDDSPSARLALQKLLEEHDIDVEVADSGEAALDFLKHDSVDAIFMDHTMPGMDGLETVAAIKRNPRTATIPVMMYTTKEGEVYVSQARALGAVGVLPKQVQPGVLYGMLVKLALVRDRRAAGEAVEPPRLTVEPPAAEDDYDRQALNTSVRAVLTRVLEEQHVALRSDILRAQSDFARQVARQVVREVLSDQPVTSGSPADGDPQQGETQPGATGRGRWPRAMAALLFVAVVGLAVLGELVVERGRALDAAAAGLAEARASLAAADSQLLQLRRHAGASRADADVRYSGLLQALEWQLNRSGRHAHNEPAFNGRRLELVSELLRRLLAAGFEGTVRLTSHLGEFCLMADELGHWQLADPDLSVDRCELLGHPLDDSSFVSDRETVDFADFAATSPLVNGSGIELELVALDRASSRPRYPPPLGSDRAEDWNRIAAGNNRVEITLLPMGAAAPDVALAGNVR